MTNGLGDKDLFELIALNAMEVMAWICYLFRSCTCCMNCLCCIILEIWIMQVSTFHYWNQATNKKTITMGSERVGHHTYFKPKSVFIWWTMRTKEDRNLHLSFIINRSVWRLLTCFGLLLKVHPGLWPQSSEYQEVDFQVRRCLYLSPFMCFPIMVLLFHFCLFEILQLILDYSNRACLVRQLPKNIQQRPSFSQKKKFHNISPFLLCAWGVCVCVW